jgi:hypothetical protein
MSNGIPQGIEIWALGEDRDGGDKVDDDGLCH